MTEVYKYSVGASPPINDQMDEVSWRSSLQRFSLMFILMVVLWSIGRFLLVTIYNKIVDTKHMMSMTEKIVVNPHHNGVVYPVSYWSDMGKRNYQEDTHQERRGKGVKDSCLYGVFDGHGGYRASQFCRDFLLNYVVDDESFVHDPALALKRSFFRADAEFSAMAKLRYLSDGTTSLVACIHNRRLYVANAGDCRAVLISSRWSVEALSVDHKPDREDEKRRITKLGGKVVHWGRWRVQGVLAVSRAIGDVSLQPYVTCEPEIQERELRDDDDAYLVLASDGIWDVLTNSDVATVVKQAISTKPFADVARELCSHAIMLGSTDNVTASIVDLRKQ